MVLGKTFDIQSPLPYFKLCGKHAKYFKAEETVCIRHKAPLKVKTWKEIPEDNLTIMWKQMEDALWLKEEDKEHAMKQLQKQYRNKHHHLYQTYIQNKDRPNDVHPQDWNWLINNKWNDSKFKERSLKNKASRSKQEIKLVIGTKSIVQNAFEMKEESKSEEWLSAVEVWKATCMKSNRNWCIPNGEEIMDNLKNVGEVYKEEILKAHVPLETYHLVDQMFPQNEDQNP
ncbi:putative transposase [Vigna unguiculata]|uniref:Putative transposase n=1 Tax=Vigna unguiculata TaxID=3917 RepID=A0A4D6LWL5_VIGUN|nr:putative transposase [Vigna unguiculata]